MTGDDDDILYKNRESIVVLYRPGHYELVGIEDPITVSALRILIGTRATARRIRFVTERRVSNHIATLFSPQHPFIRAIRQRMKEIRRQK